MSYGGTVLDEGASWPSGKPVALVQTTSGYVVYYDHKLIYGPTTSASAARSSYESYMRT